MDNKQIISAKGRVMDGDNKINKFGIIDSVKLSSFDPKTDSITVRLDDSNVPGFWMEVNIRFEHLKKWVEKMKKMSEDENYCDSSDDDD
jgi:hypothetical protein